MRGTKSRTKLGAKNGKSQTKISSFFKPKEEKEECVRSKSKQPDVVTICDSDEEDVIPPTPLRSLPSNSPNKRSATSLSCLSFPPDVVSPSFAPKSPLIPFSSPDFISPSQKPFSPEFISPTPTSSSHFRRLPVRKCVPLPLTLRSDELDRSPFAAKTLSTSDSSLQSRSLHLPKLQVKRKLYEGDDFQLAKQSRWLTVKSVSKESSLPLTPPLSSSQSSVASSPSSCRPISPSCPLAPSPPSSSCLSSSPPPPVVSVSDKEPENRTKEPVVSMQPDHIESNDDETKSDKAKLVDTFEDEEWNLSDFDHSLTKPSPVKFTQKETRLSDLSRRFGRHVVVSVQRKTVNVSELILDLRCEDDSRKERQCILRGYWTNSVVQAGDVVNVLADFKDDFRAVIDDNGGILVVNPDLLLSGTTVVSTLFCHRKAVFGEWFRGIDKGNKLMLVGNLVHQLFQDSVVSRFATEAEIRRHLTVVMNRSENLLERHKLRDDCSEEWLTKELAPFVNQIHCFINKYLNQPDSASRRGVAPVTGRSSDIVITNVHDIEENIWSPRFGLKGKLDLTVEVKIHDLKGRSKKVVPLELKTGRPSFSAEHSGQVTLYSMMSGDRRTDPESGILLYIRDGRMKEIPANYNSRQGLIQMRNELSTYLANPIVSSVVKDKEDLESGTMNDRVRYSLTQLAAPLSEQKLCSKCPYLTTCAVHYKMSNGGSELESSHPFSELVSQATSHLTKSDLEYFSHWCTCLFIEKAVSLEGALNPKNIWVMSADERELQGECFNNMILIPMESDSTDSDGIRVTHKFARRPGSEKKTEQLSDVGISVNQQVVVSIEARNSIALAMGSILVVTDSWVDVRLDRNLYSVADYKVAVFRIDAYVTSSIITSCLTNVARLLSDCETSEHIRKIVVERLPASFRTKIGKNGVVKAKAILRSLNEEQLSAVLKALMSDDYLLIKGMPGAGKTATIVALIRVISEMGHTVLLTSHTHSAVDNVLIKLVEEGLDFLRLGSTTRINPKLLRYSAERLVGNVKSPKELNELFNSKQIVAATCLGCNHSLLSAGRRFDYCIVDEASQILQPACLGPLFHCRKFVLVGDHHQLPPIVRSDEAKNFGMDESLFYRLDSPQSTVELRLQYRMNSEINRLANCLTYGEALKCATNEVSNNVLQLPHVSLNFDDSWLSDVFSSDLPKSVLLLDTCEVSAQESRDANGQLYNKVEVDIVASLVTMFTKFGLDGNDLGVICPYRNQVSHVLKALKERRFPSVEVNTVDQYQGRDKDVIVMSFVRSNSYSNSALATEILNDKRRINVAITRARKKLILVGNSATLVRYGSIKKLFDSLATTQRIVVPHSIS